MEFYELKESPFRSTPDPRFVFPSRSFSFASTRILKALQRREGLIVITGKSGTGKTALSRFVLHHLTSPNLVSVIADPFLAADELLKHLLRDFGVVPEQKLDELSPTRTSCHDLVVMLHRFLMSSDPPGTTAALVIDDAQHLQRRVFEQLRALSNLESEAGKLLQIVLIGEPALEPLLRKPEAFHLDDRVGCRIRLEPLSKAEIRQYVEHRLSAARGGETIPRRPRFSASAIRMLASVSRGIARPLNALCDRALEIGYELQTRSVTRRIVLESARQLKLPVRITAKYPVARDLAAALVAIAIVTVPLARLERARHRAPVELPVPLTSPVAATSPAATSVASTSKQPPAPSNLSIPATGPARPPKTLEPNAVAGPLQAADSYLVVVASFRSAHNAGAIASELERAGLPAFSREDIAAGWHVVLVGPYSSMDEAQEAQKQLAGRNFPDSRIHLQRH